MWGDGFIPGFTQGVGGKKEVMFDRLTWAGFIIKKDGPGHVVGWIGKWIGWGVCLVWFWFVINKKGRMVKLSAQGPFL